MKTHLSEDQQKILVILKLDAGHVFDRIKNRMDEYLRTFAVKRTRVHFKDIFSNRYKQVNVDDLKDCSEEVIIALDKYYSKVDDLFWYLNHTEDLPNFVRDKLNQGVRELEGILQILNVHIDAQLMVESGE